MSFNKTTAIFMIKSLLIQRDSINIKLKVNYKHCNIIASVCVTSIFLFTLSIMPINVAEPGHFTTLFTGCVLISVAIALYHNIGERSWCVL